MEQGYFYFISDEYYTKFSNEKLMTNKEVIDGESHNRPCYYAYKDDEGIFWMVPVSSQIEKFTNQYNRSMKKYGMCDAVCFGYLKGEYNAFLLQNLCPVTEKYILNQYLHADTKKPVSIPNDLKRELNAKIRKILRLAEKGKKLTFTNILEMRQKLLDEIQNREVSLEQMKIYEREKMLFEEGREAERENTERERQRAEEERQRADENARELEEERRRAANEIAELKAEIARLRDGGGMPDAETAEDKA